MGFKIIGNTSGNIAEVDSLGQVLTTTPQSVNSTNSTKVGYTFIAAGPNNRPLQSIGPMGRLSVGTQTMELFDPIDGAIINSMIWTQAAVTQVIAQSSATGFLILNNTAITTINTSSQITTVKAIQLINTFVPTVRILFKTPNVAQANVTMELGFLEATGSAVPTNGAFFRWSSAGEFRAVTVFNSVETQSAPLTMPAVNTTHAIHITIQGTRVEFWINNVLVADIANPAGNSAPTGSSRMPLGARIVIGGTAPVTAPELHISGIALWRNDLNTNKLWPAQMVSLGRGATQSPTTPFAQAANFANSTAPVSAALSNTAAGYTTLGGKWQFAAPAGAVTDFALFGYQVPAGLQMFITEFGFTAMNLGAAVATTATILDVGVGLNSSAVSLATADAFATNVYGPRRLSLTMMSWLAADAIGSPARGLQPALQLVTPWIIDSSRFFHVIVAVPVGTATAGQIIRGTCYVGGYFE